LRTKFAQFAKFVNIQMQPLIRPCAFSILRLKVRLDHPQQFVHATRNFSEQFRRVRVAGFSGGVNCRARPRTR
jgi:hypothetical protein